MTADLSSKQSLQVSLKSAILLYGGTSIQYGTLHDVIVNEANEQPRLGVGKSLTKSFIEDMLTSIGAQMKPEVLPDNVLCRTRSAITWWVPARRRAMFFSESAERPHLNGVVFPHPALVFQAREDELSVWALRDSKRPVASTPLHFAPYWNVSVDGSVCLGSSKRPPSFSVDSLDVWEEGFFGSNFSHPNANKHCTHPQGFDGLWAGAKNKKTFPVDLLLPSTCTLGDAVHSKTTR